ncbi:MAG: hypothetical protein QJR07_02125 [Acetobacteraceae bacterium]|nr:hypothetical protein [Acetobacteraceae bacterium]
MTDVSDGKPSPGRLNAVERRREISMALSFGEVTAICREMTEHLCALMPGADVTVVPVAPVLHGRGAGLPAAAPA